MTFEVEDENTVKNFCANTTFAVRGEMKYRNIKSVRNLVKWFFDKFFYGLPWSIIFDTRQLISFHFVTCEFVKALLKYLLMYLGLIIDIMDQWMFTVQPATLLDRSGM